MNDLSITTLLHQARSGDATARDALVNALYGELHRLAEIAFQRENPGHTLQPTILVHEAFLRLLNSEGGPQFADRAHFLGLAARVMRQILVDHGRARHAQKRGAQFTVALSDRVGAPASAVTFVELNRPGGAGAGGIGSGHARGDALSGRDDSRRGGRGAPGIGDESPPRRSVRAGAAAHIAERTGFGSGLSILTDFRVDYALGAYRRIRYSRRTSVNSEDL
jgi:hypothetical protein